MAIFDILKQELFIEQDESCGCDDASITEEEGKGSIDGDPQALVNGMIENAPGHKEQIGIILKYAANSIPDYDIWDAALDYYESLSDEVEDAVDDVADDAGIGDDSGEELPVEEPAEEPLDEPLPDEGGEEEAPVEDEEELSM